jgi:hypothetical protein
MPNILNLTDTDAVSFAGAYDLDETVQDQIRALLAASPATGTFTYEHALTEDEEDDGVEVEDVEPEASDDIEVEVDPYYWDIVYRNGELENRWQVEYDDEVNWWFEGIGQVEVDTLIAVLDLLVQGNHVELID